MSGKNTYHSPSSWGHYPQLNCQFHPIFWADEIKNSVDQYCSYKKEKSFLPTAYLRSYGDSCLLSSGTCLDLKSLNRFIHFDRVSGILRAEAGISFAEILDVIVPQGFFLPVTPGTKWVSMGGAIANDVHGKNHHQAGTFGRHVRKLMLARSNGENLVCSLQENSELFKATIGGLGLTGVIVWAEIQLIPIPGPWIEQETIAFKSFDQYLEINSLSEKDYPYTVAWVDSLSGRKNPQKMRGIYFRGKHAAGPDLKRKKTISIPFSFPDLALNKFSVALFNHFYFHLSRFKKAQGLVDYDSFFYPLDSVLNWNKIYGKRGFLQYQFLIPGKHKSMAEKIDKQLFLELFSEISLSQEASFLSVLKNFGNLTSPGLLSFPMEGPTLCMDFPNRGASTFNLLQRLDEKVMAAGGRVYPAKDARMSAESFRTFFPQVQEFISHKDPLFSSHFWQRVMK